MVDKMKGWNGPEEKNTRCRGLRPICSRGSCGPMQKYHNFLFLLVLGPITCVHEHSDSSIYLSIFFFEVFHFYIIQSL